MNTQPVMQRLRRGSLAIASAAVLITLVSCGGGHDDGGPPPSPPPSNEPPASASASVMGLIDYLLVLTATRQDTVEPLDLTRFNPQISDITEPDPRW